jgi:CubicO group peptidase (beta-lactamase class C family)
MRPVLWALVMLLAGGIGTALAAADPVFTAGGPDAAAYGQAEGYPVQHSGIVTPQRLLVGAHSHFDTLWPSHPIAAADQPAPLRRAANEATATYIYDGVGQTLDSYLAHQPVTGLLIARDDTILFEHYQYGRTDRDRVLSQSMAKTVTAMLLGIAVSEGRIRSIDETVATYVPELAGTAYGETPIRALLHMASGVAFSETYDGADDIAKLGRALFVGAEPATAALAQFDRREVPPGTRFHYASSETEVLGLVVQRATGQSLASYLQRRVWQPMGAEAEARWVTDRDGKEVGYCCFNATLRDWARFALVLAHDGAWNGRQIIPRQWVMDATSVEAPYLAARSQGGYGYGYQVWLVPGGGRQFALLGIHGQTILVDPASHLVLVQTAVRVKASGDPAARETRALWSALVERYGK